MPLLPSALFRQGEDGTLLWIADAIQSITGLSPSQWLDEDIDFWECVHEEDAETLQSHFESARKNAAQGSVAVTRFRLRIPHTHQVVWLEDRRRCVCDPNGNFYYEGSWTDASSHCWVEQHMASTAWQGALAALTPGVAHDLNNHFASILVLSDNFVRKGGPEHPFYEGLKTIRDAVQHAARLTQRLVALHVTKPEDFRYHDLNEIAREAFDFLQHTTPRRVALKLDLCPGNLPIFADAVLLRRALVALVKNGLDAIAAPASGQIQLQTLPEASLPLESRPTRRQSLKPLVCLSVTDTGEGVRSEHSASLFKPGFSSKPASEANGMALAWIQALAEAHGGCATFEAPLSGAGATFRIWLPQSDLNEADSRRLSSKSRRLLVIGKNPVALEDAASALRSAGFRVTACNERALEILKTTPRGYDGICFLADVPPGEAAGLIQLVKSRRWSPKWICEGDPAAGRQPLGFKADAVVASPWSDPQNTHRFQTLFEINP